MDECKPLHMGLHPTEGGNTVRIFYCVAGYIGGRSFHALSLPLLVWTFDCAFVRLVGRCRLTLSNPRRKRLKLSP